MEEITTTGIVVGGEDSGEADRIVRLLTPSGVISVRMRGVKKAGAKTTTSAVRGAFERSQATRAEALSLIFARRD